MSKQPHSSKTTARVGDTRAFLSLLNFGKWVLFKWKGVKVKHINRIGKPQMPCVVLCNHGAFGDFAYAGRLLKKWSPSFIVARLYFFHKTLGKLCYHANCFPKSMFTADLESTMNCMRVLKKGGILAMMPEARLSSIGKFEDIQEGTFAFLQKAGVPVYIIKMKGDFLAQPKWGSGMRRGSKVEAELTQLFTADDVKTLPLEEIRRRAISALQYNEWEWLEQHPDIHYHCRRMAEGLENILTRCPSCGKHYTIRTKGKELWCENCGLHTSVGTRYEFAEGAPFTNFALWYEWQVEAYRKEILENPDFSLRAKVTLHHASHDGKQMLRLAGEGECVLDHTGLTYRGTRDGETIEKLFPQKEIYRLLFGAGKNFEIYEGKEIFYFTPEDTRSCVDWYIVSMLLKDIVERHVEK